MACGPIQGMGWGQLTQVTLPGGGKLGIYQPRHARPKPMVLAKKAGTARKRPAPKSAPKRGSRPKPSRNPGRRRR